MDCCGLLSQPTSTQHLRCIMVTSAFLSVAGFRKSIDDLIIWVDYNLHPDVGALPGMNVPDSWVEVRPRASTFINNPFEATYRGIEFDWQTNFWYLPSVLKGLVLNVNYTLIDSDTEYQAYFIVDSDSLIRQRPPVFFKELRTDSTRVGRLPGPARARCQPDARLRHQGLFDPVLRPVSDEYQYVHQPDQPAFRHDLG